jgi:hypothetical protein
MVTMKKKNCPSKKDPKTSEKHQEQPGCQSQGNHVIAPYPIYGSLLCALGYILALPHFGIIVVCICPNILFNIQLHTPTMIHHHD